MASSSSADNAINIADQLHQEQEWLDHLKDSLGKSTQLKNNMLSILGSFEHRLQNLQATILPLYEHTDALQRRQKNVTRALKSVDKTLNYYYVANDVDASLKNCEPGDNLDLYIKHVDRLKEALEFFGTESKNATHLESTRSLYEFGCHSLEREFRQILRQYQQAYKVADLLDCIGDGYELMLRKEKLQGLPIDVIDNLAKIASWLTVNTGNLDFVNAYAAFRSDVILRSLKSLRTQRQSGPSSGHSPALSRKDGTPLSAKLSVASKKPMRQYAGDPTFRRQTLAVEQITEVSVDTEPETFVLLLASLCLLFDVEASYVKRVFGEKQTKVVMKLVINQPFAYVLEHGEGVASTVRKNLSLKQEFTTILNLLPITRFVRDTHAKFNILLESSSAEVRAKYQDVTRGMDSLCVKGLEDFIENIKGDQDRMVPRDGTVHQLTSNALFFLEQVVEFRESLGYVYAPNENSSAAAAKYFARVLSAIGLSLRNRAENYMDPYLKAVFMMNNFNHMFKALQRTNILRIVAEQNREVNTYYPQQIMEQKEHYLQCWTRLMQTLAPLQSASGGGVGTSPSANRPKDKDKQLIKDAFQNFSRDFETLIGVQHGYSVPDVELAASIRRTVRDNVVPRYQECYEQFINIPFSKNPKKYMKFEPQDLTTLIAALFDTKA